MGREKVQEADSSVVTQRTFDGFRDVGFGEGGVGGDVRCQGLVP